MSVTRGVASVLVQEVIEQGVIYEGATGEVTRGRKPTFLHIRTRDRLAVAVDVRFSKTFVMLSDFSGRQLALEIYDTVFELPQFVKDLSSRVKRMLKTQGAAGNCEGIGVVVPGMVDHRTGRVLNAPTLGWRDADVRDRLAAATDARPGENSGRACSLAPCGWSAARGRPRRASSTSACRTASALASSSRASWCAGATTSRASSGTCL